MAGEAEAGHLADHLRGHAAKAEDHARVAAHLPQGALGRTQDETHQEAADLRSRLHEVTSHAEQAAHVAQSVTAYAGQADDGQVCRGCLDPGCDGDHGEGA